MKGVSERCIARLLLTEVHQTVLFELQYILLNFVLFFTLYYFDTTIQIVKSDELLVCLFCLICLG